MDIDKWFPSMKIKQMMKEVKQMIVESKIEFREIDYDNASKYLGEEMTIEEILEEEMEEILYIEWEKFDNLKKAKNPETKDVTSVYKEGKQSTAHKECAKDKSVTNDVAPINEGNKAHNDCAEDEWVTNDVTPVCDDGKRIKAHKECAEDEWVTKDVTPVCDDENEKEIRKHKECAENECEVVINDVTSAGEDGTRNEAHKECADDERVTKDVTPVCDDGKGTKAHKESARKEAPTIISPVRNPNDLEKRKMVGKIIEIMALAGMENHVYKFENIIRRQTSGGPIGLSLTGDIADCYLIGWDKKFKEKLKILGINEILYDR